MIDGRAVGVTMNGVSRSILTLAKALAERPKLEYEVIFLCRPGWGTHFAGFPTVEARTPFLDPRETLTISAMLWRMGASLYHSPTHSSLLSAPCPWIVTLHDLIPLRWGSPLEQIYFQGIVYPFALRAKKILTVSETVRAEVKRWVESPLATRIVNPLKGAPEVEAVPNAIDPSFLKFEGEVEPVLARYGVERGRYFLCLTNDRLHKNASLAVRAFQMAREQLDLMGPWKLVISSDRYAEEPGVVSTGNLNEAETHALLRGAKALVFPSLEEGFGLPPLEAGISGCPILVSDLPVHREVLGFVPPDEVTFIDPQQPVLWVRALLEAAQGRLKPWSLSTRSQALKRYSVNRLGEQMDRIYRGVLQLGR